MSILTHNWSGRAEAYTDLPQLHKHKSKPDSRLYMPDPGPIHLKKVRPETAHLDNRAKPGRIFISPRPIHLKKVRPKTTHLDNRAKPGQIVISPPSLSLSHIICFWAKLTLMSLDLGKIPPPVSLSLSISINILW